jgi:type II secretory pathway component PulF
MPRFKYVARDMSGKAASGMLEASDVKELRRTLRAGDLYLTRCKSSGASESGSAHAAPGGLFAAAIKPQDIIVIIRQFATMVRAGITFDEGLGTLMEQSEKPGIRAILKDLRDGVIEGRTLSMSMRNHPKVFDTLVVSLIEAGETTGNMDDSLEVAAEQLEREEDLKMRLKTATLYPKIVVGAALGTIAVMLTLVVPTFKMVYESVHAKLPFATTLLMEISDFTMKWWWLMLAAAIVGTIAFKRWASTPGGERHVHVISLKLPFVGMVLRKIAIARFSHTLASGLKGGIPVIQSLTISAHTSGNSVIRDAVLGAAAKVQDGAQMAPELEKSGQFPAMVTRMIGAGEKSGQIDRMLSEINRYYERDVQNAIDKMTKMIEPAITVLVGGIVLLVLLALYMPIFGLGQAFKGA